MANPTYNGEISQEEASAAEAAGLPIIGGQQALAMATKGSPDGSSVSWYMLADGSEVVQDGDGGAAVWD
ncbi:MAG: hypothetical protein ACFB13_21200 [Kiloniellaceae bacterium]